MKKFFKGIGDWFTKYKDEILSVYAMAITMAIIMIGIFVVTLVAMTNDLVATVQTKDAEIEGYKEQIKYLTIEKNKAEAAKDSIIQTYEDSIPKQQYLDDIEYLESVILELRGEFERECNSNN